MIVEKKYNRGTYSEWLASLIGACLIAFSLGILLGEFARMAVLYILITGTILHGWGMYRMNKRNKESKP